MQRINSLDLLGKRVSDKVTGFNGIVTSVCFDLYGCNQALVHPGLDKDGKPAEQGWFDATRLIVTDATPVMPQPNFSDTDESAAKGPAEKPRMSAN